MLARTPDDLSLQVRDRRYGRQSKVGRGFWLNDDPVATAFYNLLSITFPKGEAFFIDSLRKYRDQVPPKLQEEIRTFITQELNHTREHVALNRHVTDAGYETKWILEQIDRRLAHIRSKPDVVCLIVTAALEHYTAVLSNKVLTEPQHFAGAEEHAAGLWYWHSIEEIEHKAVAYDVWQHVIRDWSPWKQYSVRCKVMLLTTRNFYVDRTKGVLDLLRQDGLTGPKMWAKLFWFAFVKPGMMRKIMIGTIPWFLPRFHPWNHNDRWIIAKAEATLPPQEKLVAQAA